MVVYKKWIKIFGVVCLFLVVFFFFSFFFNKYQVKPTEKETIELNRFYKVAINIKTTEDIINLQNYTINNISHKFNGINEINILKILKTKKGLCYDRSLILQKVMLINNIEIRPVFLYTNPNSSNTNILDIFFKNRISTHNIFEFYFNEKWYVMDTNNHMNKVESLHEYLLNQKREKKEYKYIRHLSNRNGRFISPSWIPDIY
jgi:hypothetical protein